ncbi:hypothetical protein ANANG_G00273650 [Anguilla anguilla]|uniref:Uncharacterized protein n=1 Tax=Anguilla anguilla TaxID=7936 RepID=A0A9D3LR90_ANGAN|nr:hypothetical protein ANANG_G00273650 [Anguilla anguilla]
MKAPIPLLILLYSSIAQSLKVVSKRGSGKVPIIGERDASGPGGDGDGSRARRPAPARVGGAKSSLAIFFKPQTEKGAEGWGRETDEFGGLSIYGAGAIGGGVENGALTDGVSPARPRFCLRG